MHHIFKALSDPSRLKIFNSLVIISTSLSISQISSEYDMSRQGVTKHLKILESADLITIRKEGRERYCTAHPETLSTIKHWLAKYDEFWSNKLDNLAKHLGE